MAAYLAIPAFAGAATAVTATAAAGGCIDASLVSFHDAGWSSSPLLCCGRGPGHGSDTAVSGGETYVIGRDYRLGIVAISVIEPRGRWLAVH